MWSWSFIGLYCQYAAVGLLYGSGGTLLPFCVYTFNGPTNICSNAKNITFFAWHIKIFFAILTDVYHPYGMRRKCTGRGGEIYIYYIIYKFPLPARADCPYGKNGSKLTQSIIQTQSIQSTTYIQSYIIYNIVHNFKLSNDCYLLQFLSF